MWILPGESSEEDGTASVEKVSTLITDRGGEVKSAGLWGRRTLSYPIKKNSEGAYYLTRFSVDASATVEINRALESDQGVLRHLLIKEERKKAVKAES
jgi:small subunit ribosomal protein S6